MCVLSVLAARDKTWLWLTRPDSCLLGAGVSPGLCDEGRVPPPEGRWPVFSLGALSAGHLVVSWFSSVLRRLLCVTCVTLEVWILPRWYQLGRSGCLLWATLSWTTQSRSADSSQASTQADSCQLPPVLAHSKAGQESEDVNTDSNSRDQNRRENVLDLKQIAFPTSGLITNKLYH